jgi:hypothetical protein
VSGGAARWSALRFKQAEPIMQAVGDLVHRQRADCCSRELDGKRQTVQSVADGDNLRPVILLGSKVRVGTASALEEQRNGVGFLRLNLVGRQPQWGSAPDNLSWYAEHLATGHQQRRFRAAQQKALDELRRIHHQVLAVVQQQQNPAVTQIRHKALGGIHVAGLTTFSAEPQGRQGGGSDAGAIADWRQIDEAHLPPQLPGCAAAMARLVLPTPAGPIIVTRRSVLRSSSSAASSWSRPMKLVRRSGKVAAAGLDCSPLSAGSWLRIAR